MRIEATTPITLVDGMWSAGQKRGLLTGMMGEVIDCSDGELDDYLAMALQDLDPQACGEAVLAHVLGDTLTTGQRFEVSRDMQNERPWEHYSQMDLHKAIFEAAVMVHRAHRSKVTTPKAVQLQVALTPENSAAEAAFAEPLSPAMAARLVAPLRPNGILNRLFDEALAGEHFPEAAEILWHCRWETDGAGARATLQGSEHWLGDCEVGDEMQLDGWDDAPD